MKVKTWKLFVAPVLVPLWIIGWTLYFVGKLETEQKKHKGA